MSKRAARIEARTARRAEKKAARARRKLEKLQRRSDRAKAKGQLAKSDKLKRKMGVVAAAGGVSVKGVPRAPGVPGVRRRAPRHKFRIRKGQRQMWSTKYRGWVNVKARRRVLPRVSEEIKSLRDIVDNLRTMVMMK